METQSGIPIIRTETGFIRAGSDGQTFFRRAKKRKNGSVDKRSKYGRKFYEYVEHIREECSAARLNMRAKELKRGIEAQLLSRYT